ncbi:hypothetical protein [Rhizobium alvei]|uniref:Uncharacterized protein n=1 Tax=Rhizobium alvei TaxID=1132659 RepID=A0ABT8YTK5_9HYPH|nr:hypothetical protein [Rhizobium alvei]MDO6967019.1 hypothetical protein [Rhizobium alvei]
MATLSLQDLANQLDYYQVKMWIQYYQEDSGKTGAGDDLAADLADPVWRAEITIDPKLTHAQAAAAQARIEMLDGVIGRFYMYDPRLQYPIADPGGTIIKAHTGTCRIAEIAADNKRVRFKGLPGGYQLTAGDRWHADIGTDPVHRAYHRITSDAQANGAGETLGWVSVRPHVSPGLAVNDIVEFARPSPLWRLIANGYEAGTGQGQLTPGGSLKMVQVF